MPRAKVQMSLIGNARDRAKAFARRKEGLLKKAQQLAKLCDVDVALVCSGPDGGAPPVVWESDPGVVIDRYRKLPADKRVKHTHLGYINGQLSKEEGRLDKERRQGLNKALACPGEAMLEGMDLEELLASIDVALLATAERRKAFGVADDDDGRQLGQQVSSDAAVAEQQGCLPFGCGDELDDILAWVDELMWDGVEPLLPDASMTTQPASGMIQCINGGNDVGMGSNSNSNHQCQAQMLPGNGENGHGQFPWHAYQPNTTVAFPDHGFQCTDNSYADMDGYSEMLMPSNANAAYYGSSCAAIAGNPAYMPPHHEHHSKGIGSFMDAAGGHEHETGCLADYFQCPEPLHYLSDMAQGISYYDDLEAGGCSYGRAQLFDQSHSCSGTPQFSSSEQFQSLHSHVGHQYQDPRVQQFWVMEGPPGSTGVATASARATAGLYQPWISVYQ